MVNGRAMVGPKLDNERYPDVKPVTIEDLMRRYDQEGLAKALYAL